MTTNFAEKLPQLKLYIKFDNDQSEIDKHMAEVLLQNQLEKLFLSVSFSIQPTSDIFTLYG